MRSLEFRFEVVAWSIVNIFWAFLPVVVAQLIFGQVREIAGWSRNEAIVLALFQGMFVVVLWFFVFPSVLKFSRTIRFGELDFYLLKPINARFLLSFSRFEFDNYVSFTVRLGALIIFLQQAQITVTPVAILSAIILFILGLFIFYSLFFLIATLSFWFINFMNLEDLLDSLINVGQFPTYIFDYGFRFLFFFVIPVVFVATYPTQALLGKATPELFIQGVVLAIIFFFLSQWFWNFALKHYSSASS